MILLITKHVKETSDITKAIKEVSPHATTRLCDVQYTTKPLKDDVLNRTRNTNTWYLNKN